MVGECRELLVWVEVGGPALGRLAVAVAFVEDLGDVVGPALVSGSEREVVGGEQTPAIGRCRSRQQVDLTEQDRLGPIRDPEVAPAVARPVRHLMHPGQVADRVARPLQRASESTTVIQVSRHEAAQGLDECHEQRPNDEQLTCLPFLQCAHLLPHPRSFSHAQAMVSPPFEPIGVGHLVIDLDSSGPQVLPWGLRFRSGVPEPWA